MRIIFPYKPGKFAYLVDKWKHVRAGNFGIIQDPKEELVIGNRWFALRRFPR